ncbi:hypothetical protein C8R44DRAFT_754299 [Mycena epipterygia]|nr:hypothetical protein C8R44DRAFT_754299 [Mycena epipterygia]
MCPLSISFYRTPYDTRDDDITFDDQLNPINQLLRVSRRIRHLELVSDTPAIYDPLLRLGLEDLPALEKFLLHGYNDSDSLPEFRDWIDFFGIPNLRSISLYVTTDALSLPLRWSHLTELCLVCFPSGWGYDGGLDEYGVLDVLRRCPNIVRCQIQATKPKGSERRDTSSLTLLHLQTLILGDEYPLVEALSLLVLPKLSWLQIGEKFFEEPIRFLDRPVQGLTMELDIFRFTLSNLVELLQHFPTTTDLRLYWSRPYAIPLCADDAFLSLFCPPHDVLCPALTYISFSPISCVGLISDAAALAFIRARMVMDYPLRRFQARFERRMETDILLELQSFISGGLEVDLDYFAPQWAFQPRNGISSLYG